MGKMVSYVDFICRCLINIFLRDIPIFFFSEMPTHVKARFLNQFYQNKAFILIAI